MLAVPTMLVGLVDEAVRTGRDVSSFKGIMSGGAMVAPGLIAQVEAAFGPTVQILYGQTECSGIATFYRPEEPDGSAVIICPRRGSCLSRRVRGRPRHDPAGRPGVTAIRSPINIGGARPLDARGHSVTSSLIHEHKG